MTESVAKSQYKSSRLPNRQVDLVVNGYPSPADGPWDRVDRIIAEGEDRLAMLTSCLGYSFGRAVWRTSPLLLNGRLCRPTAVI